jgi:hypothetical protein
MALKNKDGSVYRLRGPNPILKDQKLWESFQTHNMHWQGDTSPDGSELQAIKTDFQVRNNFLDDLDQAAAEQEAQITEIKVVETLKKPETIKVTENRVVEAPAPENIVAKAIDVSKIFIHCLPAVISDKKDAVYGDNYQTIKYNKPFSFEGVLLDQSDLTFKFWTQADDFTNQIQQGSIVYPKINQRRWWRVQTKVEKTGGWIITGHPSDYQPHFDF